MGKNDTKRKRAVKALVTRLLPDKRREKVLVHDWVDAPAPGPGQFRTRTVYSGVTNGTERNDPRPGGTRTSVA
jgi:hypothetical protein